MLKWRGALYTLSNPKGEVCHVPGHSNQPDPNHPHVVPQATSGTAGEFTQIFAAGAAPLSEPAGGEQPPLVSADDEFAKMFLAPTASVEAPSKPLQGTPDNEATLVFEAMPSVSAVPRTLPVEPLPATRPKQAAVAMPAAPRAFDSPSSEFTQIFSPIAPPAVPLPEAKPAAKPVAQSSGEFTQFFSAISARESASNPTSPQSVPQGQSFAAGDGQATASKPDDGFDRMFSHPPSGTARSSPQGSEPPPLTSQAPAEAKTQSSGASDFTQMFQQQQPASTVPSQRPAPAGSGAGGDSFTQIFQQIAPPQTRADSATRPQAPVQPVLPQVPTRSSEPTPVRTAETWPAFGPPPQPSGTFTDVFAAQPSTAGNSWPSAPATTAPSSQGGGFTELFQAMPTSPQTQPAASPFTNPGTSSTQGSPSSPWQAAPQSPAPQAAQLAAGGSDFTRLMQSLMPSAQGSAAAPPQNDAFFTASPNVGTSAYQESEFTRVQRASAQREAGGAAPTPSAPAAGVAVAPGLAMAPPKEKAAEKEAPAKKSKTLVILLVAMNILLLLVVIVIAFLVLRHK